MKTKDGFIQGYNAQAAVDATAQVIVAHGSTPSRATNIKEPIADAIQTNLARSPRSCRRTPAMLRRQPAALEEREIDAYIAPGGQARGGRGAAAPASPPARKTPMAPRFSSKVAPQNSPVWRVLAISRWRDRRLRFLAAGHGVSGSAEWWWRERSA